MKYLIIYMSRHGTTEKVAIQLGEKLGADSTTLVNLEDDPAPPLTDFETIIIGGSVHGGTIQQKLMKFCDKNASALLKARLGLFMCFMNEDLQAEEFEDSFSKALRQHAVAKGMFGGEFLLEKMSEDERMAVKNVKGIDVSVSRLHQTAIDQFAEEIK